MMQAVQMSIADCRYAGALREALTRSCAWHVESVESQIERYLGHLRTALWSTDDKLVVPHGHPECHGCLLENVCSEGREDGDGHQLWTIKFAALTRPRPP